MLPIWNEVDGYVFVAIKDQFKVVADSSSENKLTIDFRPAFVNADAKAFFNNGSLDNGIVFKYNIHCYDENGNIVETLSFTVSQDVIKAAYTKGSIRYGIGGLSDTFSYYGVEIVLESDTGLTYSSTLGTFSEGVFTDKNGNVTNVAKAEITE